ncbi:MAG: hypothetical protein LH606_13145 [Cytophagaceae bacterium]|nr:hypothetical protein [Cytophagaceae bacterium]
MTKVLNNTQSTNSTTGALVVTGGAGIGQNLNVGGTANFGGSSSFGGALSISDGTQSTSTTTGALKVVGGVGIGKNLFVGGNEEVDGTMTVDGDATLKSKLVVDGATDLNTTLNVDGATTMKNSLALTHSVDGYVATFKNTNGGDGDGLKIKLGKTHPAWNGSAYLEVIAPNIQQLDLQIEVIRGWIYNGKSFQVSDLASLAPGGLIVGSTISITNVIIDKINSSLGLPVSFPEVKIPASQIIPEVTVFPGFGLPDPLPNIPSYKIGPYGLPAITLLPSFTILPKIPNIPDFGFPTMTLPVLSATDVTNSLTKKNEFIAFNDKNDRNLGAIRAQSVSNFSADYIDGLYLTNLTAALIGLDIVKDILSVFSEFANLADAYNSIGVEYASGHGDYAEWLERSNPDERISSGDIVGVKGGKITKDLRDAEQIMAVSYRPIVLGNTPPAGKKGLGNKIAFMGQIPVKVMGPVKTGDYIVAKSNITGYGVAVSPADMTADDFRLVVGRAWEANLKAGPKAVNTLVGVHNGDYMKLIKKQQEKLDGVDARLTALEIRLNRPSDTPAQREKKAVASSKK